MIKARGLLLTFLMMFCLNSAASAQSMGPLMMLDRTKQILDGLNLTADQQAKIDGILDQARQDGAQLRGQLQDLDPRQRMEKIQGFASGVKTKIEAELSADQKDQFEKKLAEARAQGADGIRTGLVERFRSSLESLNLSDDQHAKVNTLLDRMTTKLKEVSQEKDADARQSGFRETMQDLREQLTQILTPEQQESLRQKMQQNRGGETEGAKAPSVKMPPSASTPVATPLPATAPATQPAAMQDMPAMQNRPEDQKKTAVPIATTRSIAGAMTPIDVGHVAPDFKLSRVDGSPVQFSIFKGHVVVLIFGSYTCPTFRDRAVGLDRLAQNLEGKANVFFVYTREAHPTGGWEVERNKLENIQIPQPTTDIARRSDARMTENALHLRTTILVDSMDDKATKDYGGFPNAAIVINRDGTVAAAQQWAEPAALRHLVEEVIAKEAK